MVSSIPTQAEQPKRRSNDPISWYLQNIGRVPLLTPAEEIELGNQVQKMMILTEDGQLNEKINEFTTQQKRTIKIGRRAKERMMKANFRLVDGNTSLSKYDTIFNENYRFRLIN